MALSDEITEQERAHVAKLVEEALGDYEGLVSPKELDVMRRILTRRMLDSRPGQDRVRAMREAPHVERSGMEPKSAEDEEIAARIGRKRRA